MKRFLFLLIVLLIGAFAASAQEGNSNDPRVNEDANACNEGGAMAGKCNVDFDGNGIVDDYEVAWAWGCGWYMIRYEAGMLSKSDLPDNCLSLIPLDLSCFNSPFGPLFIEFNGIPNQPGNVILYFEGCGHESIAILGHSALIFATSLEEAFEICSEFGTVIGLAPIADYGYTLHPDDAAVPTWVYGCDFF